LPVVLLTPNVKNKMAAKASSEGASALVRSKATMTVGIGSGPVTAVRP